VEVTPFITKDGSRIREFAHTDAQSLAEATVEPGAETEEHFHRNTEELYLFTSGMGRMRLSDEERDVRAGDCVVIPPKVPTSSGTPARIGSCCSAVASLRIATTTRS